jgi:hypothetical protein
MWIPFVCLAFAALVFALVMATNSGHRDKEVHVKG